MTILSHSQCNVGKFLIKLHISYVIKVLYFLFLFLIGDRFTYIYFPFRPIDLLISTSHLDHSRHIEDELFVRSTRKKFHPHTLDYTLYYN